MPETQPEDSQGAAEEQEVTPEQSRLDAETEAERGRRAAEASLMANIEMNVFGHP